MEKDRQRSGRRLRILMSSFACEPGRGSEQEVGWRWAMEMSKHVDVTVVTQTRNRPGIERWLESHMPDGPGFKIEYLQFPNPIYRLKSRFNCLTLPYYAAWQFLLLRWALRMQREKPFDLAHHVTFVTFRVPVYLKYLGIPVVFGPVGGAETAPWKLLSHRISMMAWCKEAARNVATVIGTQLLRVLRPIHRGGGICLAATPGMERVFRKRGFPTQLLSAIGVDVEAESLAGPPSDRARRFLFVGRLHPLKGVQLLIEAFEEAGLEDGELTIIGPGDPNAGLRELSEQLGVNGKIRWLGKVPREELAAHYRSHDVLVAPSLYESGGLAVLEAMQQSRPAIVLAVGGHDLSVDENCGTKVSPVGSAGEVVGRLAEAMKRYAITPGLAEAHGKAGRQKLLDRYNWPSKATRMRALYEDLVSVHGRAS